MHYREEDWENALKEWRELDKGGKFVLFLVVSAIALVGICALAIWAYAFADWCKAGIVY